MVCCSIDITIDPSSRRDVFCLEFRRIRSADIDHYRFWCGPRGASLKPPMETMKPGVPRVLGSGIELDTDLRDRVPLHVTHDQFHDAKTRPVPNGWSAV